MRTTLKPLKKAKITVATDEGAYRTSVILEENEDAKTVMGKIEDGGLALEEALKWRGPFTRKSNADDDDEPEGGA